MGPDLLPTSMGTIDKEDGKEWGVRFGHWIFGKERGSVSILSQGEIILAFFQKAC